jgi:hypothetical protein
METEKKEKINRLVQVIIFMAMKLQPHECVSVQYEGGNQNMLIVYYSERRIVIILGTESAIDELETIVDYLNQLYERCTA